MKYSYSRLECFKNCPRAFRYQYIDKIEVEAFESIESFVGHRVHEALEALYRHRQRGRVLDAGELLLHYQNLWERSFHQDVVVNDENLTIDDYRNYGRKYLLDYHARHKPFNHATTLETELRIDVDLLGDGEVRLIGFIDRLDVRDDGCYELHDYKTGRKLPTAESRRKDKQLPLYELGVRQKYSNVKDVDLVWHYLHFNKELRSKRTDGELAALKTDLLATIRKIERAIVDDRFPKKQTGLCNWCEYQQTCRQDHGSKMRQETLEKYS